MPRGVPDIEQRLDALFHSLSCHVPDGVRGPLRVSPLTGGQSNPTFLITDARGKRLVLRKKPAGELLPSAHAVDREFRVISALAGTDVPVPHAMFYCADSEVIGTPFYVMEFVEGRIFWDPALPELDPTERRAVYSDMNRVVASLHQSNVRLLKLGDYGRTGGFFERQIRRWASQYESAATEPIESIDKLIGWLPSNIPDTDRSALIHGDLRIDNMVFHPTEPRVVALLDWELSTLGHPLADLAYHMLPWRLTSSEFRGMAERRPLPEGIPTEEAYLRNYSIRTGSAIDREDYEFAVVYSMFRLAVILQGIFKRSLDGTAASPLARETGQKAKLIADIAWAQVAKHFPRAKCRPS